MIDHLLNRNIVVIFTVNGKAIFEIQGRLVSGLYLGYKYSVEEGSVIYYFDDVEAVDGNEIIVSLDGHRLMVESTSTEYVDDDEFTTDESPSRNGSSHFTPPNDLDDGLLELV